MSHLYLLELSNSFTGAGLQQLAGSRPDCLSAPSLHFSLAAPGAAFTYLFSTVTQHFGSCVSLGRFVQVVGVLFWGRYIVFLLFHLSRSLTRSSSPHSVTQRLTDARCPACHGAADLRSDWLRRFRVVDSLLPGLHRVVFLQWICVLYSPWLHTAKRKSDTQHVWKIKLRYMVKLSPKLSIVNTHYCLQTS